MDFLSLLIVLVVGVACHALTRYISKSNSREPPSVPSRLPAIGHIVGLFRFGLFYYTRLSNEALPAFTLDILHKKLYVIKSASLVSKVQRLSKIISFDPVLRGLTHRMTGINGDGLKLLQETNVHGRGLQGALSRSMHSCLIGPGVDKMNDSMLRHLKIAIDNITTSSNLPIDLHGWCRQVAIAASTESIWGELNPFKSVEVQDAFWEYESNLSRLLFSPFPQVTASVPRKARDKIARNFIKYFEIGGHLISSDFAFARWKIQNDAGATIENIARNETASSIGILSNTVPSTFWTIFDIYSRPELLAELRAEITEVAIKSQRQEDGITVHTIDLADIRNKCSLLVSTFQEVLRLRSCAAPTRIVREDIEVDSQCFLRKGSIVQMPAYFMSREILTWGPDAESFNPRRFVPSNGGGKENRHKAPGFMAFGTSPNICPGRHFASGVVVATVAMLMLRFDIQPVAGSWEPPTINPKSITASIPPPREAFMIRFTPRERFEGMEWRFKVTMGTGKVPLITG
ncbi:hypothetical protein LOY91_004559 [Ophidiomyces ophidiicola]|nr:hypothetical protein LOY91_004559 [Ophidiomyces ophidiicola]